MMWIDRLRLAVITLVALIAAAGLGASIVAQQVAEKRRAPVVSGGPVQAVDKPGAQRVLRLTGSTDFDPATLTIVRSQFDSRVDKVFVDLGSAVKKGDPLLELFSTDLAAAKTDYEAARDQHDRDLKTLNFKAPLVKAGTLPRQGVDRHRERARPRAGSR